MPTACTVTGTFQDATSASLQGNAFVRFRLRNFSGFVPRVLGTAIIVEPQIDAFPNASGQISVPVWGNDQIDPGGTANPPSTFYTVEFWNGGRITSQANFSIVGSTFDLGTSAQTNAPSAPKNSAAPALLLQTKGTKNGSQTKLNLVAGSNISLVDDGNGDVTIATSGGAPAAAPWMMGPGIISLWQEAGFNQSAVNNKAVGVLTVIKFFIPVPTVAFTHVNFQCGNNTGVTDNLYLGFYSSSANRIWSSGALSIPGPANYTFTIPSLTLAAGTYYFAFVSDNNSATLGGYSSISGWLFDFGTSASNILNKTEVRYGFAANHLSGGILPATLGTITGPTTFSDGGNAGVIPGVVFSP